MYSDKKYASSFWSRASFLEHLLTVLRLPKYLTFVKINLYVTSSSSRLKSLPEEAYLFWHGTSDASNPIYTLGSFSDDQLLLHRSMVLLLNIG
jgi:hypothetical protein